MFYFLDQLEESVQSHSSASNDKVISSKRYDPHNLSVGYVHHQDTSQ